MNKGVLCVLLLVFAFPALSVAELDLDKDVLIIPDTHNAKPYIWDVARNPKGYELVMDEAIQSGTDERQFSFEISQYSVRSILEMHVFVTDSDLHFFRHISPLLSGGKYRFSLEVPRTDTYRFEIVFRTEAGWINLKKDLKVSGGGKAPDDQDVDKGYSADVKLIPRKVYAEHVVTFLFRLIHDGVPINDIEKVDGTDMRLASWDEDLKEFIYVTSKQNPGGPEVAVSAVFMRPGKRAVFADFRHQGKARKVEFVIDLLAEPPQSKDGIESLRPAD